MESSKTRRDFLFASAVGGTGLVLNACGGPANSEQSESAESSTKADESQKGGGVIATEDLMREHGVLKRALLVYHAAVIKLRGNASAIF